MTIQHFASFFTENIPFVVMGIITAGGAVLWVNEREWGKALVCIVGAFLCGLALYFRFLGV